VPRGMSALGYTLKLPTEDRFLLNEAELHGEIATLLGGRSAEELIFGAITTGAANDLERATDLAERMVTSYGMSKVLGPLAYQQGNQPMFLNNGGSPGRRAMSEETSQAIDREVKSIVENAHTQALEILKANHQLLESVSQQLLAVEVLEGETLQELLAQVKWEVAVAA
jgi:cell division protease FtsH